MSRWPVERGRARSASVAAVVLLVAGVAFLACAKSGAGIPPGSLDPDRVLFERGSAALKDRKWLTARDAFRRIVDSYPQSAYRAEAKLGIGDSYLGEATTEAYVLAVNEFREFLTFFPTHPRADYAQYRLAMAFVHQMLASDRDQTNTREAIRELELFVERYPSSLLKGEVGNTLREVRDRLSESEYRVGLFYFRAQWYPGAIERFRRLLKDDPDYTHRDAVYFHLAESLLKLNQKAEALPYYERLIKEFERSNYLTDARKRIAELKVS